MNYYKMAKLSLIAVMIILISVPCFSQTKDSSLIIHKPYSNFSNKTDSVFFQSKSELFNQLESLEFVSGTVYFSGKGFPNVISSSLTKTSGMALSSLFDKCTIGSVITFEKCKVKDDDGKSLKTLHKSILLR